MDNPVVERLNKSRTKFSPHQWEGSYSRLYDSIRSYADLKRFILEGDVNTKIFAMNKIVPLVTDLLSEGEKKELSDILRKHLTDNRLCDIPSAGATYADEEDTSTVSNSARYALGALTELEYNVRIRQSNIEEVVKRGGNISEIKTPSERIREIEGILRDIAKTKDYKIDKDSRGPEHKEGYGGEGITTYHISLGGKVIMIIRITQPYATTSDDLFDYACPPEIHVKVMDRMVKGSILYQKVIGFFDQLKARD